jgi:cytoskeletal protein CcmA (bactofilin family)
MVQENIERPRYYQRQYLGAQDFMDEQAYQRDMRRRHNLAHHRWGIVTGLELSTDQQGGVYVQPGIAIDGYGREIVVFSPYQLDTTFLQDGQFHSVWLQYQEVTLSTVADGYEACNADEQDNRIGETFQPVIDPLNTYGTITVDGRELAANLDVSVPQQEFPVGLPRWLVPLGQFRGDGKQFTLSTDGRRYIGSVTSEIVAPAAQLSVRSAQPLTSSSGGNINAAAPPQLSVLIDGEMHVKHGLSVEEDIRLQGGSIDFEDVPTSASSSGTAGQAGSTAVSSLAFSLARVQQSAGKDVRVQIGKEGKGNNRFVIGANKTDLFWVADSGDVQLTTGSLSVKQDLTVLGSIALAGNLSIGDQNLLAIDKNKQGGTDIRFQLSKGNQDNNHFVVGTDKTDLFTVAGNGDVSIGGTLQLTYDLSVPGTLTLDEANQFAITTKSANATDTQGTDGRDLVMQIGAGNIGKNRFVVATRRATLLTLTDDGHVHLLGSLGIDGDTTIGGALSVQNLNLTGSFAIQGDLLIGGSLSVNGLHVSGPASLEQGLSIKGAVTTQSGVTIAGPIDAQQALSVKGAITAQGSVTVGGPIDAQQALSVKGAITAQSGMTVAGPIDAQQDVNVKGAARVQGGMNVGGMVELQQGLNVEGQVNAKAGAVVGGLLEARRGLTTTYADTNQQSFSVQIGQIRAPRPYLGDNIYGTPNLWLDAAGIVYLKKGYQTSAMDGAEFFSFQEPVSAGDVLVLAADGQRVVQLARRVHDPSVIGVVSTDPGFILGGAASMSDIERVKRSLVPVALLGTVPCKVDADIAPIAKGDLLTTSPTPGYAQKVLDYTQAAGAIIGKAMGALEHGKGLISIVVMLA